MNIQNYAYIHNGPLYLQNKTFLTYEIPCYRANVILLRQIVHWQMSTGMVVLEYFYVMCRATTDLLMCYGNMTYETDYTTHDVQFENYTLDSALEHGTSWLTDLHFKFTTCMIMQALYNYDNRIFLITDNIYFLGNLHN